MVADLILESVSKFIHESGLFIHESGLNIVPVLYLFVNINISQHILESANLDTDGVPLKENKNG